jgi:hypothetical protein
VYNIHKYLQHMSNVEQMLMIDYPHGVPVSAALCGSQKDRQAPQVTACKQALDAAAGAAYEAEQQQLTALACLYVYMRCRSLQTTCCDVLKSTSALSKQHNTLLPAWTC